MRSHPPHVPSRAPRTHRRRHRWRAVLTTVAPVLISLALRVLALTVRIRYVGAENLFTRWARGEQVILAFWHNRVVMMPIAGRGQRLCIMNSQSRDGEIATRALARWDIRSVRGSATRGGASGFLQLVRAFRDGYHLAVVPDGPRGPRYVAKSGVIHLARATGAVIVPVTYAAARERRLGTWDGLLVPLPFSRVEFRVADPVIVPRDAGDEQVEELRRELEARLNAITLAADRAMHPAMGRVAA
jgi:lysophospholipid acyltransferase (LPLAT)-like uncharacterized protein